jgi:cobalt-zinc-cadmium efflux system membrane fusion protein
MFINGTIIYLSKEAPVTIKLSALQRWNEWDVIFIQKGNSFEATPVELGEKNGKNAEVIKGIKAGQSYVSENSYLLKAELGKSSASHDH